MPQFHLYRNSNKATQKTYPYLLDIQSDLLSDIRTTVVLPLMPMRLAGSHTMSQLNPVIRIKNEQFAVMTQSLAGVDRNILGDAVGDFSEYRSEIFAAVDFVLSGI
jgi:toxin CcdB